MSELEKPGQAKKETKIDTETKMMRSYSFVEEKAVARVKNMIIVPF